MTHVCTKKHPWSYCKPCMDELEAKRHKERPAAELALLERLLYAEIKLLGRAKIMYPTKESIQKKVEEFNRENNTHFIIHE